MDVSNCSSLEEVSRYLHVSRLARNKQSCCCRQLSFVPYWWVDFCAAWSNCLFNNWLGECLFPALVTQRKSWFDCIYHPRSVIQILSSTVWPCFSPFCFSENVSNCTVRIAKCSQLSGLCHCLRAHKKGTWPHVQNGYSTHTWCRFTIEWFEWKAVCTSLIILCLHRVFTQKKIISLQGFMLLFLMMHTSSVLFLDCCHSTINLFQISPQ